MSLQSTPLTNMLELSANNYVALSRLLGDLRNQTGFRELEGRSSIKLHIRVLEQTSYTTCLHITQRFNRQPGSTLPDVTLRAYHDAETLDVVSLQQGLFERQNFSVPVGLDYRTRINVFLSKWLAYLLDHYQSAGECIPELQPLESV